MHKSPDSPDSLGSAVTVIANYDSHDSPGSIGVDNTSEHFQSPRSVTIISRNIPCSNCSKRGSGKCPGCCLTEQAFYSDNKRTIMGSVVLPIFNQVVSA